MKVQEQDQVVREAEEALGRARKIESQLEEESQKILKLMQSLEEAEKQNTSLEAEVNQLNVKVKVKIRYHVCCI